MKDYSLQEKGAKKHKAFHGNISEQPENKYIEVWWEQRALGPALKTPTHACRWPIGKLGARGARAMTDQAADIWNLFKFHLIPIRCWFPVHNNQASDPLSHPPLSGTGLPFPNGKAGSDRLHLVKKRWQVSKGFGVYGPNGKRKIQSYTSIKIPFFFFFKKNV